MDYEIIKKYADIVEENRLCPNNDVSQWYMKSDDMVQQILEINKYIKNRKIVFLGDGDGISILVAILASKNVINKPEEITVLDIDERELNLYKRLSERFDVSKTIKFRTSQYNIFNVIPSELRNSFDLFYINPPYSSATNPVGLGFVVWLERCMELTKGKATGIMVYPVKDEDDSWIADMKLTFKNFFDRYNLKYQESTITHEYFDTKAISSNLIINKENNIISDYMDKKIPLSIAKNLYHNDNPLPEYILDDGSKKGKYIYFK